MRTLAWFMLLLPVTAVSAADPEPPLEDAQLSIHTLVREDIFAGWRLDDMERFARGEKNIDLLLLQRPQAKADLLAWKGAARLFRAVLAHEAKRPDEFQQKYQEALKLLAEAHKLGPRNPGVSAVSGGALATFADRLPAEKQPAAWQASYENYRGLWSVQAPVVDRMPKHVSGELLAGLAQSSQRTGRKAEMQQYIDKILEVLPDTAYARVAKKWKDDPAEAAKGNITCKSCHAAGRLSARIAANAKQ